MHATNVKKTEIPFGISCRQHFYELQAYVVTDIHE